MGPVEGTCMSCKYGVEDQFFLSPKAKVIHKVKVKSVQGVIWENE